MRVSKPWLIAALVMVAFIWSNSLVPGSGSSSLSLAVTDALRSFVGSLGLPTAWITNFLVRKAAHFTEYLVLGVLATRAFDPGYRGARAALVPLAIFLVLAPSIDETIQLFVADRSGQVTDVMLDCCGAATGVALSYMLSRLARSRRRAS